jgi:NADH:quinone reductase (non-electrogenic)
VQWVTPDDQPKPSAVTGKMAARIKEMICKSAAWSVSHPTSMLPSRRRHIVLTEEPLALGRNAPVHSGVADL